MDEWRHKILASISVKEQEIEALITQLKSARQERDRLRKKLYDGRTNELRGQDSLLVLMSDIRPSIKQWIEIYNNEFGKGGQLMLSVKSKVSTRKIRTIINGSGQKRFITLQTADRLLTAIGLGYRVVDLEVIEGNLFKIQIPEPPQSQYFEE